MRRGLPQSAIPPWERQKGLSHGTESESDNLFDDRQPGKVFRQFSRYLLNQTRKMGGLAPFPILLTKLAQKKVGWIKP